MISLLSKTALIALIAVALEGCFWITTKKEGDAIRDDIQKIDIRVKELGGEMEKDKARLMEMIERARVDMAQLDDALTKATRVLSRNSADFGAEMESIKDKLREVDGAIAEIGYEVKTMGGKIEAVDKKVQDFALAAGIDMPVDESKVPPDAAQHLKAIKESLAEGRYGEVRALADVFIKRYPKNAAADDVQLLTAKSYIEQKRWARALGALRQFTDNYPKSDLTPEVLYEMASAFFALGDCTDARIIVETITAKYAKSPFAEKASMLGEQMLKNKSRCTS